MSPLVFSSSARLKATLSNWSPQWAVLPMLLLFLVLCPPVGHASDLNFPTEIVLGMSAALTGNAADLGKSMQRGILAGLERANRNGGVNARKLRLIALDDAYEPARTGSNMLRLIEKDNVLAVIGNV